MALVLAAPAAASPEDIANDIAGEVMSPYCEGVTLHDCPSGAAIALRERIKSKLEGGMSKAEVLDWLESEYGPTILAAPPAEGGGLFAYLLPIVALLAGAVVATLLIRRWAARPPPDEPEGVSVEERERLDAELAAFRSGS